MSVFELQWWVYPSMFGSFFGVCLGLNYLVKKFNEARIEERLIRMLQKASTTQATQVNGPLISVETSGAARLNCLKTLASPAGISLVFNREDNKRRSDPYNLIKPINSRISLESVNIISPSGRAVNFAPMISIESADVGDVAVKSNSSQIHTENVLVKNNEYECQAVKENSSTAKSDCYVTELITVQKNEFERVSGLGALPVTRKDSNTSKLVSQNEGERMNPTESSPFIHVKDDTGIENIVSIESSPIEAEGTTPDVPNDSVTEKLFFKNKSGRRVSSKTRIKDMAEKIPTDLSDKNSNDEVGTGCFIKKSVEKIVSKIVNLKNKNEDPKIEKKSTDILIATKQSLSHSESGLNVTEIFVQNKESGRIVARNTPSPTKIDDLRESFPVKKIDWEYIRQTSSNFKSDHVLHIPVINIESEHSAAKETASAHSHSDRVGENFPIKKSESEHISAKETASAHSHNEREGDNIPVKKVVSKHIADKETIPSHSHSESVLGIFPVIKIESEHIRQTSYSKSDHLIENIPVKNIESKHIAAKETASAHSHNEREGDNIPVKKVVSKHIAAKETTSSHSHSDRVLGNFPVVKIESEHILQTSSNSKSYHLLGNLPVTKVESKHIAAKETTSSYSQCDCVSGIFPVVKIESEHILQTFFNSKSDHLLGNFPVTKVESKHIAAKETASAHSHNEREGDNIPVKTVVSKHIVAKETTSSHSQCDCVSGIFPVVKIESEHILQTFSNSKSDHLLGNFPVTKVESKHIAAKETAPAHSHNEREGDNISVKKVVLKHIVAKETTSSHSQCDCVSGIFPVVKFESEHILQTFSNSKSDHLLGNFPVTKVESKHIAAKETASAHSHNERERDNIQVKKVVSKHIVAKETTSSHSHSNDVLQNFPVIKIESEHIRQTSCSKSDHLIENIPVKNIESKHIAAKETASAHSHNERDGEHIPTKKVALGHLSAKETTCSHYHSDHIGENFPVKKSKSEHISAKETLLHAGIEPPVRELVSVKKSVTMIESRQVDSDKIYYPAEKSIIRSNYKAREYTPVNKRDSGHIVVKETVLQTRSNPIVTKIGRNEESAPGRVVTVATPFFIRSELTIGKHGLTKKRESESFAAKESHITNNNTRVDGNVAESSTVQMSEEDIESDNFIKKTEDGTVTPDISKTSDDPVEETPIKSLTDKIKELLEDEDSVDIELNKPSSSAKKNIKKQF